MGDAGRSCRRELGEVRKSYQQFAVATHSARQILCLPFLSDGRGWMPISFPEPPPVGLALPSGALHHVHFAR